MPRAKVSEEKPEHLHRWYIQLPDQSQENCNCGAILISRAEYDRRQEEWDQYWKMCDTTRARFIRVEMSRAIKEKNFPKMARLRKAIAKECKLVFNEHGEAHPEPIKTEAEEFRPHFLEPAGSNKYVLQELR